MRNIINKIFVLLLSFLLFSACVDVKKEKVEYLFHEWKSKKIWLPASLPFVKNGIDSIYFLPQNVDYKILSYIDSVGCTSCKLKLPLWQLFINELSEDDFDIPILFVVHTSNRKNVTDLAIRECFHYPICFDENDSLNKLNHFPVEEAFHTFLLDKDNKVLAIGNPIHNPRVKALYMKIIRGGKQEKEQGNLTRVAVEKTSLDLGTFPWQEEQKTLFTLKNVGEHPLIIEGTTTSCDCTTVSYSKESVAPGNEVKLEVVYKAEKPEPFYRTISVYCNTPDAPIELEISGSAVE